MLEALQRFARDPPSELALAFPSASGDSLVLSWPHLWEVVVRLGRSFRERGVRAGGVALIASTRPCDQALAALGVMQCGALPAVLSFPSPKQSRERLRAWLEPARRRSRATWMLCAPELAALAEGSGLERVELPRDLLGPGVADEPEAPAVAAGFIQFSSGTTGLRKGVLVTAEMLRRQAAAYAAAIGLSPRDRVISWLPLYHDMGLVACLLTPLRLGASGVHLDPFEWLRDPGLLLRLASDYGATLTWMPNFAFELLARKTDEELALDGRRFGLRAIINCSEPIRAATHEAFLRRFRGSGIDPGCLQGCYAMAENVFAVTQTRFGEAPRVDRVSRAPFARAHEAVPAAPGAPAGDTLAFVSSGRAIPGTEVRIAGGLADRRVGEIEIRGDCLFSGYVGAVGSGDEVAAFTGDGWFRTGDLGYLVGSDLFVTGRSKDLIIHRGENVYPGDVEATLGRLRGARPGRAVVFGEVDEAAGTERIIAMLEPEGPRIDGADLESAARREVHGSLGVVLAEVVVVPPGTLIKSTSGKLSRPANRDIYERLRGARSANPGSPASEAPARESPAPGCPAAAGQAASPTAFSPTELRIARLWEAALGMRVLPPDTDFFAAGGDSLTVVAFLGALEEEIGRALPALSVLTHPTVAEFARMLDGLLAVGPAPGGAEGGGEAWGTALRLHTTLHAGDDRAPVFWFPPGWGTPYSYLSLRPFLGKSLPSLHGLVSRTLVDAGGPWSPETDLDAFARTIRAVQPSGPYRFAGWSAGATTALVMAERFAAQGHDVSRLFLFDLLPAAALREQLRAAQRWERLLPWLGALVPGRRLFRRLVASRVPMYVLRALMDIDGPPSSAELVRILGSGLLVPSGPREALADLTYEQLCALAVTKLSRYPQVEMVLEGFLAPGTSATEAWRTLKLGMLGTGRQRSVAMIDDPLRDPGWTFAGRAYHFACTTNPDPRAWQPRFRRPLWVRTYDIRGIGRLPAHACMFHPSNVAEVAREFASILADAPRTGCSDEAPSNATHRSRFTPKARSPASPAPAGTTPAGRRSRRAPIQ